MRRSIVILFLFSVSYTYAQKRRIVEINELMKERVEYKSAESEVRHGSYTLLFEDRRQLKGSFQDDKPHGRWRRFDTRDNTLIEFTYYEGVKHGKGVYYDQNRKPRAEWEYKNGKPSGKWTSHYGKDRKKMVIIHDDSGLAEQYVFYYADGEPAKNVEVKVSGGDTVVIISEYYPNNRIARYSRYKNGKKDGSQILYYENGIVREELLYREGKIIGPVTIRTERGKPMDPGDLKDGNGTLIRRYHAGGKFKVTSYKNGILHDSTFTYARGGREVVRGYYENGKRSGSWSRLKMTYKKLLDIEFKGDSAEFKVYYSYNNKEYIKGTLRNNTVTGKMEKYNFYGDVEETVNYKNGVRHGPFIEYIKNTPLPRVLGQYEYGIRSGEWQFLNTGQKLVYYEKLKNRVTFNDEEIYKAPSGYVIRAKRNAFNLLSEPVLDDGRNEFHDIACYIPEFYGFIPLKRTFSFFHQFPGLNIELRNTGIPFGEEFIAPQFYGDEPLYISTFKKEPTDERIAVKGTVLVRFKVDELGVKSEYKVMRSVHPDLDRRAVNVLRNMPPLLPALYNGMPVPAYVLKAVVF